MEHKWQNGDKMKNKTIIIIAVLLIFAVFAYAAEEKMFVNLNMNSNNITDVNIINTTYVYFPNGGCVRENACGLVLQGTCTE